jgi:signal transduction histidine kinase
MNQDEIYQELEADFSATFIKELIPGILHNFANPLNGIMGRSKLLERRIEENIKKLEELFPEAAMNLMDPIQRIRSDIRSVNQESESFFEMFRDVSGKFYSLATKSVERINLSALIAAEMRFANFNLEFKHEIKKEIQLDGDIPDIRGNTAELSLVFWRLIRFAMTRASKSSQKEFFISTEYDEQYIRIVIKDSGDPLPDAAVEAIMQATNMQTWETAQSIIDKGVYLSFMILHRYGVQINIRRQENINALVIGFPYRQEKAKREEI